MVNPTTIHHDHDGSLFAEEMFEDTKRVIRSRKSKDRHYNDQKKKDKRTNNDPQDIIHRKLKIEKNEIH